MVSLFSSLNSAAAALRSFQEGINVSQNNVNNINTPGYAKQRATLISQPFNPSAGMIGGVRSGPLQDSRSLATDQAVQRQLSSLASFSEQTDRLTSIETTLAISGSGGISAALDVFFGSFASLSLTPESTASRQQVLAAADQVAHSFNKAAEELSLIRDDIDRQLQQTVGGINDIASRLRAYNEAVLASPAADAGVDATAFADLEALSQLVNIDVIVEANRTLTVLVGGQTPLVIGREQYKVGIEFYTPAGAPNPGAAPVARITGASGKDVTETVTQGKLGGLLQTRHSSLAPLAGDATQEGSLNRLAREFADRVNTILTNGIVSPGPPAVTGVPLFAYGAGNNADVARSLAVDPAITPGQIASGSAGPPFVSNGSALEIADLRASRSAENTLDGMTYLEFYGALASTIGTKLGSARQAESRATLLATQARDLREQTSGVDLNEEAVQLTQYQKSYEVAARIVQIVDELLETILAMKR